MKTRIKHWKACAIVLTATAALTGGHAQAAVVTFDDLVTGATSYGYDGDGDGIKDVIFSTVDPKGFNTVGPGPNMSYIHEPGIEGTSLLPVDLRADFIRRAVGSLKFGYALNSSVSDPAYFASIKLFDVDGNEIASASQQGDFTITNPPLGRSSYPEGEISLSFAGEAAYATFDFTSQFGRFILDDFSGTYGSTERPEIPEPGTLLLAGLGLIGIGKSRRRR